MKNFLKELKIAVINEDMDKLKNLSEKTPVFSSVDEAKEIDSFIKKAVIILNNKKESLTQDMVKIKKMKNYTN